MDRRSHWEQVHGTKGEREVSWYEEDPRVSLELIAGVAGQGSRIVDVGGGRSYLAERLVGLGYRHVAVVDIASNALDAVRDRMGELAERVRWIVADVAKEMEIGEFDVWHDRAVFHFLTEARDRQHYVELLCRSVPIGGHVILGAFGKSGPERCSGLEIVQYDRVGLEEALGGSFRWLRGLEHLHTTPSGKVQQFTFGVFERR